MVTPKQISHILTVREIWASEDLCAGAIPLRTCDDPPPPSQNDLFVVGFGQNRSSICMESISWLAHDVFWVIVPGRRWCAFNYSISMVRVCRQWSAIWLYRFGSIFGWHQKRSRRRRWVMRSFSGTMRRNIGQWVWRIINNMYTFGFCFGPPTSSKILIVYVLTKRVLYVHTSSSVEICY